MRFLFPLGFLALLAIPVLIFIYIIKNRYTEQTVTSTYLWTLSERFLRRRIPINRLTGIISLLLQILAVVLIAIIVAHPIISIPNGANEYCFILDGSGSMNIQQDGSTRFDDGKKAITDIINGSMKGSTYTLICVGETIYKSSTFTDKEMALQTLEGFEVSYTESSPADAITLAKAYFDEHPAAVTYLVTDRTYQSTQNVEVINVIKGTENYGISDVTYDISNDSLTISGKLTTYGSDVDKLTLKVYFSNIDETTGTVSDLTLHESFTVENLVAGEETPFDYTCSKTEFVSFKVSIVEEDNLPIDNEVIVYNVHHENLADTLIVYPLTVDKVTNQEKNVPPNFLIWSLLAANNTRLKWVTEKQYKNMTTSGYGLYIFYSCVPEEMPREGAVWFIKPTAAVPGSNFSFQGEILAKSAAKFSTSKNTTIRKMLDGVVQSEFGLKKYAKLGVSGAFTEYIKCDGNPMLVTGTNVYGNREVVFAFDLADSASFTLHNDCITLMSHLLSYSFPEVLEETSYYCGETLTVNIISGCTAIRIDTPQGKSVYPDTSTGISEYQLNEVGIYTIHLTMKEDPEGRDLYVYASLPVSERVLTVEEPVYAISGEPSEFKLDGIIDNLLIIFIILAVISVADYGVYCYEQYQLR